MQKQCEEELRFLLLECHHIWMPYLRLLKENVSLHDWDRTGETLFVTAKASLTDLQS